MLEREQVRGAARECLLRGVEARRRREAHAALASGAPARARSLRAAAAAAIPLRTALSIVAGQPVSVHAPARYKPGVAVRGPGRRRRLPGAATEISEPIATLRERYLPALERLLPAAAAADVLDFTATREPRATFRAAPGSAPLRPGTRTSVPGLYLAGAWTATDWPATMESAVRSGRAAATAVLEDLARGRHDRRAAA